MGKQGAYQGGQIGQILEGMPDVCAHVAEIASHLTGRIAPHAQYEALTRDPGGIPWRERPILRAVTILSFCHVSCYQFILVPISFWCRMEATKGRGFAIRLGLGT